MQNNKWTLCDRMSPLICSALIESITEVYMREILLRSEQQTNNPSGMPLAAPPVKLASYCFYLKNLQRIMPNVSLTAGGSATCTWGYAAHTRRETQDPLSHGKQTGNKRETNRKQTGNKRETNGKQTGNKRETNGKQTGNKWADVLF